MKRSAIDIQPGDQVVEYPHLSQPKRWDTNPLEVVSVRVRQDVAPGEQMYEQSVEDGTDRTVLVTTRGPRGGTRTQYLAPQDDVELI